MRGFAGRDAERSKSMDREEVFLGFTVRIEATAPFGVLFL